VQHFNTRLQVLRGSFLATEDIGGPRAERELDTVLIEGARRVTIQAQQDLNRDHFTAESTQIYATDGLIFLPRQDRVMNVLSDNLHRPSA
jgi:hypothetical protein